MGLWGTRRIRYWWDAVTASGCRPEGRCGSRDGCTDALSQEAGFGDWMVAFGRRVQTGIVLTIQMSNNVTLCHDLDVWLLLYMFDQGLLPCDVVLVRSIGLAGCAG